jgi:beta-lactamase class A
MTQLTRRHWLYLFGSGLAAASEDTLTESWRQIAAATDGTVGAAALHLRSGRHASLHGDDRFPLASVCKLPAAMHILAMVDEGRLARAAEIEVVQQDVTLNNSEVGHRWPKQRRFPLDELLLLMVAHSDNTAVETLYRIGGGAAALGARLRRWHLEGVRIDRTERECNRNAAASMPGFIADPRDTGTPDGTVLLLQRLFSGGLLSPSSTGRMIEMLQATTTGADRIKGLLPAGTLVAHKTGTTGTQHGLNGSTNDVGVITLPNGAGQLALAVYVRGSARDLSAREMVIARIAKAAFDRLQRVDS